MKQERTCPQWEKRETPNHSLATLTFFKESHIFSFVVSQRGNQYVYPSSFQKTDVIHKPIISSRTWRYRQPQSLFSYPKWIHRKRLTAFLQILRIYVSGRTTPSLRQRHGAQSRTPC